MAGNKDVRVYAWQVTKMGEFMHGRIQYAWQVTTRCMAGNKDVHGR